MSAPNEGLVKANALQLMGVSYLTVQRVLPHLNAAALRFEINTPKRICGWIAQQALECRRFQSFREDMTYRDADRLASLFKVFQGDPTRAAPYVNNPEKLANFVYANREGNGPVESGDGFRYRGRGGIQTTFKNNYAAAEQATGRPYLTHPELLEQPEDACLSAGAFWHNNGLNELMDADRFADVTRRINKAMLAAQERADLYKLALKAYT